MDDLTRAPAPRRTPRRVTKRKPAFYSVLDNREQWELDQLGEASLSQEMSLLRLRVAELLTASDTDWKEALRAIEVLVRMVRVQQGIPIQDSSAGDALADLGHRIERLFAEDGS